MYAYDGVSGTAACAKGKKVKVQAFLDDAPVGEAEIACAPAAVTPPPMVRIDGPLVEPGLHELRIDVVSERGVLQTKTLLTLPAFDIKPDGSNVVVGAEVSVGVAEDDLSIGPPQVYAPTPP
ncbi:MAG: hypothetical protein JWP97_980 [Labilithrix sp.]|nr:hypothetical protein [Labilithrix sp.]